MAFTFTVSVDGTDIAPIVLEGAQIEYGRSDLFEQPNVPVAVLQILTRDATDQVLDGYPEFGLGDWASDLSGFIDAYANPYAGVTSRLTIGVPVVIGAGTASGFTDAYADAYEGINFTRFTGRVQAIDYEPGTIQLTATPTSEEWARIFVGGTGIDEVIPVETEAARAIRYATEAGIALTVDGPGSVDITAVPPETRPSSLMLHLVALMQNTGGVVFTDRTGFVNLRTRDYVDVTPDPTELPPGVTLLDPLRMSLDLGLVRNRVTLEYGPESTSAGGVVFSAGWDFKTGAGAPVTGTWNRTDDGSPATGESITMRVHHTDRDGVVHLMTDILTSWGVVIDGAQVGDRWVLDVTSVTDTVPGPTGYSTIVGVLTALNGTIGNNENTIIALTSPDVTARPTVTVQDPAQIAQYGIRDYAQTTIIENGSDAAIYAAGVLELLSPHWAMPDAVVALGLADDPTIEAVCALEQGDPVMLPQLLLGSPQPTYQAEVLGYTETLSRSDWQISLHLSPQLAYQTI